MEGGLLKNIEGLSAEDLTTEILAFILSDPRYAPYQRLFFSVLFEEDEYLDSAERGLEVLTQYDLDGMGRADLFLVSDEKVVIIENKFYALFSMSDQMLRYYKYLQRLSGEAEKKLILLTTTDRIGFYMKHIRQQFEEFGSFETNYSIYEFMSDRGVRFGNLSWEKVLKLFGRSDFLIDELATYIDSKYFTSSILTEEELRLINSTAVPELMEKIWAAIDETKDMLSASNYNVKRTSQSRIFYGFAVEFPWGSVWVDYSHKCWKDYETPCVLQLRKEWLEREYGIQNLRSRLKDIGFIYDEDLEYIYPIRIENEDLGSVVLQEAKTVLEQLDCLFTT